MKVAMWSGPRNLSTAMLYAFAQRGDTAVWDEPFYASYLSRSGVHHPLRDSILQHHEADPSKIAESLAGSIPCGFSHWYQKHMTLHMLDGFPMGWAESCVNVHLLRHPARVVASYMAKRERPTLDDIGYQRQAELFRRFPGPVIDSADVRRDPKAALGVLCAEIMLPFDQEMLNWPQGPKPYDGFWASHWYGAVHASTGFAGREGPLPDLKGDAADLVNRALPYYRELAAERLNVPR